MHLHFDRGTLVLEEPPAAPAQLNLPGFVWDPRVSRWRAPARLYPEIVDGLRAAAVPYTDGVPRSRTLVGHWQPPSLRPYQRDALAAWRLAGRRGIVALPTGAGKTRLAIAAMAELGARTLCLVPTRVLLEQWLSVIAKSYAGPVGVVGDGQARVEAITVATYEGAYRRAPLLGDAFELVVVDEVHHFGGADHDDLLRMSTAPARLGLTATLPKEAGRMDALSELVGACVHVARISELVGRYLADFVHITIPLDLDANERARYDALVQEFQPVFRRLLVEYGGAPWSELVALASRNELGRRALSAWRAAWDVLAYPAAKRERLRMLLQEHGAAQKLIFAADARTAVAIAKEHLIMPITSEIVREERAAALAAFSDRRLRALVSARVLNEGFDVPDAEVGIVVGGAHGEQEHAQRVGRLLRPQPGKRALIFELVMRDTAETERAKKRRRGLR